ncbi:hypothetical protein BJ165DRAFT_1529330 [Panaeolus papilionaceus]|nr:hypothetical protein BJ165DRAFT_1529330 [Panaeolus papilionaceus]
MAPIRSPCLYSSTFLPLNRALAPKDRNAHSLDKHLNGHQMNPHKVVIKGGSYLTVLISASLLKTFDHVVASDLHQGCLVLVPESCSTADSFTTILTFTVARA